MSVAQKIASLNTARAEIDTELKALESSYHVELHEAAKSLTREYEWRIVTLDSPFYIRFERRYTPETVERIAAFKILYPSYADGLDVNANWHGMTYLRIGDYIRSDGGGYVIIRLPNEERRSFHPEPYQMTVDEATMIDRGEVPSDWRL